MRIRGVIIPGPDPDPELDFRTFWHFLPVIPIPIQIFDRSNSNMEPIPMADPIPVADEKPFAKQL